MIKDMRDLRTIVKYNRTCYLLYRFIFSSILRLCGLVVRANKKEVLLVCYGGRSYGDNIKPIYLRLLEDARFKGWCFVWAFVNPSAFILPDKLRSKKCKIDTVAYFYHALRAKLWITNVDVERGLNFKNRDTVYVNTWHGVPVKLIRADNVSNSVLKSNKGVVDLACALGSYDARRFESAFRIEASNVVTTGSPRNDIMFDSSIETVKLKIARSVDVDYSKKIILYAPTWRDWSVQDMEVKCELRLSYPRFLEMLGDDYILLVRAHGIVSNPTFGEFTDVSSYTDVEDLLMVADILVSDYSGIIFDFSLLDKPIVLFPYDLGTYVEKRGLYVSYDTFFPFKKCYTDVELYNVIKELDYERECDTTKNFRKQCGLIRHGAAKNVIDAIWAKLETK